MCVPISPTTAHPRSRTPVELWNGTLPWDNCYHPTCYDLARVHSEWRDYFHTPCADCSDSFCKAFDEDERYGELLRAGLDDDRILRILDGQEDGPDTDDASETDSQNFKMFMAKIPGIDKLEEEWTFAPVLCIDHVLSNVPEISDPSQLHGDVDLFREIMQEYQLARYGSVLLHPPVEPADDDTSIGSDNFSMVYSGASMESFSSLPEAPSSSPDLHEPDSTSEVSLQVAVPIKTGKWKVESLLQEALADVIKCRKFFSKS
ncbi:hypothetical protein EDD18DRAFT_1352851 [Armillaria luteobubalina]|uniref:Uncharacterized protein n=1 Tax=Armillaria luteobubalina TaxID=153913 RepID=A0AA39Q664_9AGAR|nr:hypothetical protein EDD18DRAFT_1352851 [Armillaria luteobubalina]